MTKRILIAAGALLAVVVLLLVFRGGRVEVTVATAARDTLSVSIPADGRTRALDRFTVAAPISGRLTRLDLKAGDTVERGQLIGRLYPAPQDPRVVATVRAEVNAAEAQHRESEARLREAQLQAEQADREAERRRPLLEVGAITEESLEQAELQATLAHQRLQSAEASVAAARASLEAARARLLGAQSADEDVQPVDVTAPVSGRVESVPDESERVLAAGSPIVVLADSGAIEVVLDILSEDAVRVHAGDDVVLSGWGGEGNLHATVRTVTLVGYTKVSALGVEEQRVDVLADLPDPPPTLGTGYRVSGDIVVWRGDDVLTVPTSAVFRVGDSWELFAVQDGRAQRRDVDIGQRNEDAVQILEGVDEGEQVILFPPETIDDGVAVRIVD